MDTVLERRWDRPAICLQDHSQDRLSALFREAGRITGDHGMVAAFEIEPPFVFNTAEHLLRIHRQADHPALKAIYDPYDACIQAKRLMDSPV